MATSYDINCNIFYGVSNEINNIRKKESESFCTDR